MNHLSPLAQDVASLIVGATLSTAFAAVVLRAIRLMFRHQLGMWASRTALPRRSSITPGSVADREIFDYRFVVDNLEPVPLDSQITIVLNEEGFPLQGIQPLFPADKQTDLSAAENPQRYPDSIRVYSGASNPSFLSSEVTNPPEPTRRNSHIRFEKMDAYDTWTFRLLTTAAVATIQVVPKGVPHKRLNPLRPWIAVTTNVGSLTVSRDGTVSSGSRFHPGWLAAFWTAAVAPCFYILMRWVILREMIAHIGQTPISILWDVGAIVLLILMGLLWFIWIRQPIDPAIQGYRGFRSPDTSGLDFEGEPSSIPGSRPNIPIAAARD